MKIEISHNTGSKNRGCALKLGREQEIQMDNSDWPFVGAIVY